MKRLFHQNHHQTELYNIIDPLANYISVANQRNAKLWPINISTGLIGDETKTFDEAVDMLKRDIRKRIDELDTLIKKM